MRPVYLVFGVLLLAALASAFNISNYLYDNENMSSVAEEQISTSSGVHYTLYTINGVPTLLVEDAGGSAIEDYVAVEAILRQYYTEQLLPSSSEWDEIQGNILAFNKSRNYQSRFGPIEEVCLQYTGYTTLPCDSYETCYTTANVVCSAFTQGGGGAGCYPEVLAPMILDYSNQVKVFDKEVPSIMNFIYEAKVNNDATGAADAVKSIDKIYDATTAVNSNALRFDGNCRDCVGLCPVAAFDLVSLEEAKVSLSEVSTNLAPLNDLSATSKGIVANTGTRLEYREGTALLSVWEPKWVSFKEKYTDVKTAATELASYLADSSFVSDYTKFDEVWTSMENRMTTRNFNGVEMDMSKLQNLVDKMDAYAEKSAVSYQSTLAASNDATDALIYARWNVRKDDPASVESYNSLASKKNSLDATFAPPMTSVAYESLAAEYAALADETQLFVSSQNQIGDSITGTGSAFGQTAINAVFSLTDALYVMPASQRTQVAPAIPPIALLLVDLAAISVALVVFVTAIVKFKHIFRKKAMLGAWVALLFIFLFILGAGSVGLFILIDQSAQSGNLNDFENVISGSQTVFVAVDKTGASSDGVTAMGACAQNISGQILAEWGIPVETFEMSSGSCVYNGQTLNVEQCLDMAGNEPIVYLHYDSVSQDPKFYAVYQKQAELYGNEQYYTRCEIGDVLH